MHTLRKFAALAISSASLIGCGSGDGSGSGPDAGGDNSLIDADTSRPDPDGSVPSVFSGLELRVSPDNPLPEHDFSLYIRAVDTEGRLYRDYEGTVGVEASDGELLGTTESQTLTEGTAFLTLRFDEELEGVTLTVTDDDDSSISSTTAPFDVFFEGEPGEFVDVIINEVNWFGPAANGQGTQDVWIELRNISDKTLDMSQWKFEGAGVEGRDVFLFSGTILEPGDYLVVSNFDSGSVSEIDNVQMHLFAIPFELPDEGMQLILRDVEGTIIDTTTDPEEFGGWPAGLANRELGYFESMERRDDLTGGGYSKGDDPDAWYTWNRGAGVDTTSPGFADLGTPGGPNSDPNGRLALPYGTSFEAGDPRLELLSSDEEAAVSHTAPAGTEARTGDRILTTDSLLEDDFDGRPLRTVDCIALDNGDDPVRVSIFGMESEETTNDPDEIAVLELRSVIEWYNDSSCGTLASQNASGSLKLPIGEYEQLVFDPDREPPSGATHIKVRIEGSRSAAADDEEQLWAADDLRVEQVATSGAAQ